MEIDSVGRGGLLVDAPETGAATAAEQNERACLTLQSLSTLPRISLTGDSRVGSVNRVTMVVLRETWELQRTGNEFETKYGEQYRVLDIDSDGNYRQRLFRFDAEGGAQEDVVEIYPDLGNHYEG